MLADSESAELLRLLQTERPPCIRSIAVPVRDARGRVIAARWRRPR